MDAQPMPVTSDPPCIMVRNVDSSLFTSCHEQGLFHSTFLSEIARLPFISFMLGGLGNSCSTLLILLALSTYVLRSGRVGKGARVVKARGL